MNAAGFVAVVIFAGLHAAWVRRPPTALDVLGLRRPALGIPLVLVTAGGVPATQRNVKEG